MCRETGTRDDEDEALPPPPLPPQPTTTHQRTHTHTHTHKPHTLALLHAPGSLVHAHAHTRTHAQAFRRLHGPSQSNPRGFVLSRSRPAVDRDLGQSRTSSICKLAAQAEAAKAGANQDGLGLRRRGEGCGGDTQAEMLGGGQRTTIE